MDEDVEQRIAALRGMLEEELDRRLESRYDWWPLVVGVLGVLLGLGLLSGVL